MSLIHIDNSMSTDGTIASLRLLDEGNGTIVILDGPADLDRISGVLLTHSSDRCTLADLKDLRNLIYSLLDNPPITLYTAQGILNHPAWQNCRMQATVEFQITTTGHGEITHPHHVVLLVKTPWLDERKHNA